MKHSDRAALGVIVVGFAAGYALYGLFRHWHFGSSAFDLGIFDQVVWHLSRFDAPASSIRGFSNFLGDHFFPVIVLFAPLYWVAPRPETLIVAQAVLFAASIVPVFLFARSRLPAARPSCWRSPTAVSGACSAPPRSTSTRRRSLRLRSRPRSSRWTGGAGSASGLRRRS